MGISGGLERPECWVCVGGGEREKESGGERKREGGEVIEREGGERSPYECLVVAGVNPPSAVTQAELDRVFGE